MRTMTPAVAMMVAMVVVVARGYADEEKIPVDKLPKAVVEAIQAKFPKAELKDAEHEKQDGKIIYEVTIKDGATKIDVDVTENGTITGYEKEIALKDVPKIVLDAVATEYLKGISKSAQAVYTVKNGQDTLAYYEVTVEVNGKKHEVEILPNGKLKPKASQEDKQ